MHEVLTNDEMAEVDRRAVALGVPSLALMENAGKAVADEAAKMVLPDARIAVLCGPGNNGGDGFVAARYLKRRGFDARVACLVPAGQLTGDAAVMARKWDMPIRAANPDALQSMHLVIDALFGAGLSRPLDGAALELVEAINASGIPVLSVDVPSGLNGTTGAVGGAVVKANRTITFFRKKPGHLLMPGRSFCGAVVVAEIGMPDGVLDSSPPPSSWGGGESEKPTAGIPPTPNPSPRPSEAWLRQDGGGGSATFENVPSLWHAHFPWPKGDGHKYTRGHAVVVSGPAYQTGAARLSARGALRIGAGLVTVAASPQALLVNAAHLTSIMLKPFASARDLAEIFADKRMNAVLIGPGCGVGAETCALVEAALASGAAVVLDADALTSFAHGGEAKAETVPFGFTRTAKSEIFDPATLFTAIGAKPDRAVVMTPHEGEFKRLFPEVAKLPSKLERAREAAKLSGAIVVLKGPDTVVASPDGRAAVDANAPPTLATAGSGDVLAGFITGLIAQGMPAFEAACAAVWLHGECAITFGIGLIAEDLPEQLPAVLCRLKKEV